jgi:drug/metabolite transporter (DMT)-like permease
MKYGTGVALVIVAGILWSCQGLIFRQIDTAGTWATLFWRSVGMLPVLLAYQAIRHGGRAFNGFAETGLAGVIGGMGLVGAFGGAIYAIQATTIANAVFLFTASPFIAAILGLVLLGERVRPETWGAMVVGVAGIFVMVREGLETGALAGNIAALLSALGFATFTVTLRWRRVADTMPSVILGGVFSLLTGAVVALMLGQPLAVPMSDALWAMAMGAGTLTGGMILYSLGGKVIPAAEMALLSNIEVVLSPIIVWAVLGETASANTFIGGAVLLAAVTVNGLIGARRAALA